MSALRRLGSVSLVAVMSLSGATLGLAQDQLSGAPRSAAKSSPSSDALSAIKGFQAPADLKVDLWASEPMLKNPVAFNSLIMANRY